MGSATLSRALALFGVRRNSLQLHQRPNPSVKRTRNGVACPAVISFSAKHTTPLRSAYLER